MTFFFRPMVNGLGIILLVVQIVDCWRLVDVLSFFSSPRRIDVVAAGEADRRHISSVVYMIGTHDFDASCAAAAPGVFPSSTIIITYVQRGVPNR